MRIPALAILALAIVTSAIIAMTQPTRAQTYDPRYPICLKVIQNFGGERYDCRYDSIEQCRDSQGGLPAMCVVNPYYRGRR
jgi:hypothetical protein